MFEPVNVKCLEGICCCVTYLKMLYFVYQVCAVHSVTILNHDGLGKWIGSLIDINIMFGNIILTTGKMHTLFFVLLIFYNQSSRKTILHHSK